MWCIGELTHEYRQRMHHLLALYEQPFDAREPVVCIDEKSLQLIAHRRAPLPMTSAAAAEDDYGYVRNGTTNLFVAVEPKAGHLMLDKLNIHLRKSFEDVLGVRAAAKLLRRVQLHYTPKHASWLNMAEIEIGILTRQCLDRRLADSATLGSAVAAWQRHRNDQRRTIGCLFTRRDADRKLARYYVPLFTC